MEVRTKTPIEKFYLEMKGYYFYPWSNCALAVAPFPVAPIYDVLEPKDRSINPHILHTDFWTEFWKPHFWPPRKREIYRRLHKANQLSVPDKPPQGFAEWRAKNKTMTEPK